MRFRTKVIYGVLFACLFGAAPLFANDSPATEESIRELLQLTGVHSLVDAVKVQMNTYISKAMREANQGNPMTPQKQAILDNMQAQMIAAVDATLTWDNFLPLYIKTYQESFTQDELDGMTAFYKTPAGQAVVKKLPLVTQNVMQEMMSFMKPLQQRIQQIQQEALQQLKDGSAAPKAKTG